MLHETCAASRKMVYLIQIRRVLSTQEDCTMWPSEKKVVAATWFRLGIAAAVLAVPAAAQRAPLFKSEVLPVLEKNCVSCHGDKQKMAGLDLSTFNGMMVGSSSG